MSRANRKAKLLPPTIPTEAEIMAPVQVITASRELLDVCEMAQKAKAFDLIAAYRRELGDINKATRDLAKKSGGDGSVMSQYLGRKMQIERAIDAVFMSFVRAA